LDRVKNAVLLLSDFGRVRSDQGSLVKDVIVPYAHRINVYNGDIGVDERKTLLFFMGNRYRKDVSLLTVLKLYVMLLKGNIYIVFEKMKDQIFICRFIYS
jgi:hypothetical protein